MTRADEVRAAVADHLGIEPERLTEQASLSQDLGLDSLAFVEIQLAMQQEYGFTIPDEDAEQITTIGEAVDYTNRRLSEEG